MDDATRGHTPMRRMATARPVTAVPRRGGRGSSGEGDVLEVSRARWGGVTLVLAALLGAITLAVMSPSDSDGDSVTGSVLVEATPSPGATTLDDRVPTGQPGITSPKDGWLIGEWYVDVAVAVPEESLPKRTLTLVILRGDEEVKSLAKPPLGRSVRVTDVPLLEGENVLSAVLRGPGGWGPSSDPVTVTQDRDAPVLKLTAPQDRSSTIESEIMLAGTSEPGASVVVENAAKRWDNSLVVGPSGTFEVVVPLGQGRNRIIARSTDSAGMERRDTIIVTRKDGRPVVKVSAPRKVARAELPKEVRVVVDVTDIDGNTIEGATVSYNLGGPGWTAKDFVDETDADGRSTWLVEIAPGASQSDPIVSVEVIAPNRERTSEYREILIS